MASKFLQEWKKKIIYKSIIFNTYIRQHGLVHTKYNTIYDITKEIWLQ